MQKPRDAVNGQIKCSMCGHLRPLSWYTRDSRAPLGVGYRCRACRPKGNKLSVVEPDHDVIHISKVKLLPPLQEKMAAGSWERVVQRAAICTNIEQVVVYVGKNYFRRRAALSGLFFAAKNMKMKISVQHGFNEIYVSVRDYRKK